VTHEAAQEVALIAAEALLPGEVLAITWSGDAAGGDVHAPNPWKTYDLLPAHVTHRVEQDGDDWIITLSAKALGLFVSAEASVPGRFSNNAFTLFPGHDAVLRFHPETPGERPDFTIRDLHSATYGSPTERT
jgi:beta-mannosidase